MRGLVTVFTKELADYFISWRGVILFAVVLLTTVVAVYGPSGAFQNIRAAVESAGSFGSTEFIFLRLFTVGQGFISFLFFISFFLIPIVGIALGFDAINDEKNSGTLSRLLSQPIYRDAVFNGKFLAGIATIAIMLASIVLLISGLGLILIGVPPSSEEVLRLFLFVLLGTLYGAFWLGLAMLFSVFLKRVATSALATIAVWIFFIFYSLMITSFIADAIVPVDQSSGLAELVRHETIQITASRASPIYIFTEATTILLVPGMRTASEVLQIQLAGGSLLPLPLGQSLLIMWPNVIGMIAIPVVLFAISYYIFVREEIRAT